MPLKIYKKKRNFRNTPEPEPKAAHSKGDLTFSVQKHAARRLHYDLRLEHNGVLLSWAIPKGPSMNPKDKRLAIHVEDHPLDYRYFEGVIPEGNYGAGTVELWDRGTYEAKDAESKKDSEAMIRKGLEKGHLELNLHGGKLNGTFDLIHLKNADKDNMWLFVKKKDLYADSVNGMPQEHIKERDNKNTTAKKTRKKSLTRLKNISPMLATLVDKPFNDKDWIFEVKWDGYRALAYKDKKVELISRGGKSFDERYPQIVDDLNKLNGGDFILDGEIVILDEKGRPMFQLLQNYQRNKEGTPYYFLFDILRNDGEDLVELPLIERKAILKKLLGKSKGHLRYSDHIVEKGIPFFDIASKKDLEGIMAKRVDSTYQSKRSHDWLKIKTSKRQEVVIGGFTQPKGSRKNIGALLVGIYEGDKLKYAGHVGGGFTEKLLEDVYSQLKKIETSKCPFVSEPKPNTPVSWVKPKLVCEVSFAEWTNDGQMRQPIFKGMRVDKPPKDVVKEKTESSKEIAGESKHDNPLKSNHKMKGSKSLKDLKLTNPDKIYWKKDKITKGDMIRYYESIAPYILPYLKNRPIMLHRYPDGIEGENFYQKDAPDKIPDFIKTITIEHEDKKVDYFIINDLKSLLYVINLGSIELHPFNSSLKHLHHPDYAVMDLDPENVSFDTVIDVAKEVHEVLDQIKAPNFCKTSGSRGLHIYIPLPPKYDFDQVKQFIYLVATAVHKKMPNVTSLERSPKSRQKKIYLDFLQNRWAQTMVCAYSLRGRPGAPVSMPLDWSEVKKGLNPADFTIHNALTRLKKKGDPFSPVLKKGANLAACLKKLEKLI